MIKNMLHTLQCQLKKNVALELVDKHNSQKREVPALIEGSPTNLAVWIKEVLLCTSSQAAGVLVISSILNILYSYNHK